MLFLITSKISEENLKNAAEDLGGYIKFVVDVEKEILTAGGVRHVQGKELLLQNGSMQENLWGGGFDLETNEEFLVIEVERDSGIKGQIVAVKHKA